MSTLFTKISEKVGWERKFKHSDGVERDMLEVWPTTAQVREALDRKSEQDIFNLVLWHRYLKMAETPRQEKILNLIDDGLANMTI